MTYVSVLNRLLEEHARIRDLADEFEELIAARRPDDAAAFWRLRWRLLSLILQNLRHERETVMEPLLRDPRPDVVALARRFEEELADVSSRYLDDVIRWDSDEGMADWTMYGDQVRPLLGILRDRLDRKERLLYPLVWPEG